MYTTKTPDQNDFKLSAVVVLDTLSRSTDFGFKRARVGVTVKGFFCVRVRVRLASRRRCASISRVRVPSGCLMFQVVLWPGGSEWSVGEFSPINSPSPPPPYVADRLTSRCNETVSLTVVFNGAVTARETTMPWGFTTVSALCDS